MTTNRVQQAAITTCNNALQNLLEVTATEIVKLAKRRGITRIDFNFYSTTMYRGAREVTCQAILDLEAAFCQVHPTGFINFWTAEKGWVV